MNGKGSDMKRRAFLRNGLLIGMTSIIPIIAGCKVIQTIGAMAGMMDEPPKHDMLSKGKKRVAVVPRSALSNSFELQNAPREIARHVNVLLDTNVRNNNLNIVEQSKVEAWLDNVNNDFYSFLAVGRDRSIEADIVIGFDITEFRIRNPQNPSLFQGRCEVQVTAIETATSKELAKETLTIIEPPNTPIHGNPRLEPQFRASFVAVVAQQIAALFHHHDRNAIRRMNVDSLEKHFMDSPF